MADGIGPFLTCRMVFSQPDVRIAVIWILRNSILIAVYGFLRLLGKHLSGRSFAASFTDPTYAGRSEQYFEIISNRSIYMDGWKANAQHTFPWRSDLPSGNWDDDKWELYNLDEDFSEANDLAASMPEKLEELKKGFDAVLTISETPMVSSSPEPPSAVPPSVPVAHPASRATADAKPKAAVARRRSRRVRGV